MLPGLKGIAVDTVHRNDDGLRVIAVRTAPDVICHEDGTTGWPATMDHLFGSLGVIGGRGAGVN